MKKYNFISGLPRSGSTLLSSILNQNPIFSASISDQLFLYTDSIIELSDAAVGIGTLVDKEKRISIIRGIFDSFYNDGNEVCFNTNRAWTGRTNLLKVLYPNFKMIVMVRDVRGVCNSFELLNLKNPLNVKPLYGNINTKSVYERTNMLMGLSPNGGSFVQTPLSLIRQSMFSQETDNICYVEYTALAKQPEETMKKIYNFLGEEYYQHNYDSVECSYDEYDSQAKIKGLHDVRKKVEYKKQPRVIPDDLWYDLKSYNFWNDIDKRDLNWIAIDN